MNDEALDARLLTENLRMLGVERAGSGNRGDIFFGAAPQIVAAQEAAQRFAIYPLQSEREPLLAGGIMLALAHLLEDGGDCRVHRMFASQIELPMLGETARLAGELRATDDHISLELRASIPFGGEAQRWQRQEATPSALLARLPQLARELIDHQDGDLPDADVSQYPATIETRLDDASLRACWDFERSLFFALAGIEWPEADRQAQLERLLIVARRDDLPFAAWLARCCLLRSLLPGNPINERAIATLPEALAALPDDQHFAAQALANLARCGEREQALAQLEIRNDEQKETIITRALAAEYARAFRLADACEVLQAALQTGADQTGLALDYARQLVRLSESDQAIDDLPLTAPAGNPLDTEDILSEACAAYEIVLRAEPADRDARYECLLILLELSTARFWDGFGEMAGIPAAGESLRELIDELESWDGDLSPGRRILDEARAQAPERLELYFASAELLLLMDERDAALAALEEARASLDNGRREDRREWERLVLVAADEEFEIRLGEINASLRGGRVSESDLEFLEDSLESAPNQLDLYLMLSAGYQLQGDLASALEVLLDAREQLGDEAAILHRLGAFTYRLGERETAQRYLDEGRRAHPHYLPILTQLALHHFDQGEDEAARPFIARAESLDAESPSLLQLKAFIAREMRNS